MMNLDLNTAVANMLSGLTLDGRPNNNSWWTTTKRKTLRKFASQNDLRLDGFRLIDRTTGWGYPFSDYHSLAGVLAHILYDRVHQTLDA